MTKILILAAAAAALGLAACADRAATVPKITPPTPAQQLQARIDAEVAYDAGVNGAELAVLDGTLKGEDLANARLGLASSHIAIVAARAAATGRGAPSSDQLTATEAQSDADYARVLKEMSGPAA